LRNDHGKFVAIRDGDDAVRGEFLLQDKDGFGGVGGGRVKGKGDRRKCRMDQQGAPSELLIECQDLIEPGAFEQEPRSPGFQAKGLVAESQRHRGIGRAGDELAPVGTEFYGLDRAGWGGDLLARAGVPSPRSVSGLFAAGFYVPNA
jgi:hypothetical protein